MLRRAAVLFCQLRRIMTVEMFPPREDWGFSRSPLQILKSTGAEGACGHQSSVVVWSKRDNLQFVEETDYAAIPYLRGVHATLQLQHSCTFSAFSNTCDWLHCSSPSTVTKPHSQTNSQSVVEVTAPSGTWSEQYLGVHGLWSRHRTYTHRQGQEEGQLNFIFWVSCTLYRDLKK
jgi:hypothetical protein